MASPFLRAGPDLALERPGIARLLVNLPIGFGDRGGAHQPAGVEIGERRVALALLDAIAHPFGVDPGVDRSEEHTSELQSRRELVCRLLLEKKNGSGKARSGRMVSGR